MINGEFIKKFRQLKGVKQVVIAKNLSISQQAYAKIEQQEWVGEDKLDKLLYAMGCNKKDWEDFLNYYKT